MVLAGIAAGAAIVSGLRSSGGGVDPAQGANRTNWNCKGGNASKSLNLQLNFRILDPGAAGTGDAGWDIRHSDAMDESPDRPAHGDPATWLLLVYRIPSEPTRLRAGVWRKLKGLGAIYIQSSAAALPASPHSERTLRALRAEITEMGGTATLFSANTLAGQDQLVESFNAARDDEYEEIIDKCHDFLFQVRKEYDANHFTYAELEENEVDLVKLKGWLDRIRTRDVLGAHNVEATTEAVQQCEHVLEEYAARVYSEEGEEPSPL
jgi:hypothetical protein